MNINKSKQIKNKIPITIGVVGHLDAIITSVHQKLIVNLFEEINDQYPNSPVYLFTQLAPGADTIVAEIFLKIKEEKNRDYELIVPLPFEIEKFTENFTKEEKQNFTLLISKSFRNFILDNQENDSNNDMFRSGGKFVADSSIVLISLWDGENNNKKGGTADIVKYKINGSFEDDIIESIFDVKGSLISLTCNRKSSGLVKNVDLPKESLLEAIKIDSSIKKALKKIENLNRSLKKINEYKISNSDNYLLPNSERIDQANSLLKSYYSVIDSQAISSQKKSSKTTGTLFIIGFFIIVFFECYKHHLHFPIEIKSLNATITLMLLAYVIFQLSHKIKIHSSFIENRVLAEAIRIQFFWNLGDLKMSVSSFILRIHKKEFSWIKHIIQAINGVTYNNNKNNHSNESIDEFWLNNQYNYFVNKISLIEKKEKKLSIQSKIWFFIAAISIVALLLFESYIKKCKLGENELHDIIIVLIGVSFGLFALLRGYISKKGYEQTLNQYSLMKSIYSSSIVKIKEIKDNEFLTEEDKNKRIKELYYLTGKEALVENGNWYLIFKEREPEVEGIGG